MTGINAGDDCFSGWLAEYSRVIGNPPAYDADDMEDAYTEGLNEGWARATEYYRSGSITSPYMVK